MRFINWFIGITALSTGGVVCGVILLNMIN